MVSEKLQYVELRLAYGELGDIKPGEIYSHFWYLKESSLIVLSPKMESWPPRVHIDEAHCFSAVDSPPPGCAVATKGAGVHRYSVIFKNKKMYINYMEDKESLVKFLGMIVTDGCLTGSKGKLKVRFTNKSNRMHLIFRELSDKIRQNNNFISFIDSNGVITTEINSNIFNRKIRKLVGKNKILPDFVQELNDETISQVLRLMFTCDGSPVFTTKFDKKKNLVRVVRRIKFFSKNRELLIQIKKLLNQLKFDPQISKFEVILEKKADVRKFGNKIRFVNNVQMGKNSKWNFLTKNEVLNMMLKSYAVSDIN